MELKGVVENNSQHSYYVVHVLRPPSRYHKVTVKEMKVLVTPLHFFPFTCRGIMKGDDNASVGLLATCRRRSFLLLLVVIVFCLSTIQRFSYNHHVMVITTPSLKKRETHVVLLATSENDTVPSKTTYSSFNTTLMTAVNSMVEIVDEEMLAKEVVATDSVSFFFIPNSPNETNLTRLEESIIMLNEETNDVSSSPFESCKPTAQVQIFVATGEPFWTLKTFDKDGQAKQVGGDELYVVYRDNAELDHVEDPTAVALIHDNGDGSYRLDFVTTPMKPNLATGHNKPLMIGIGNLIIYFDYTCDIGSLAPPSKARWKSKGSTSVVHTKTGVAQPPIRIFQPPTPRPANLSSFPMVNFIGASTMAHLVVNQETKQKYQQPNKITQMQNRIHYALSTKTANEFIQGIQHPEMLHGSRSALIMGSDIWDILTNDPSQGPGFKDHLAACAHVVELARRLYPNTTVMWKSPTAMHILRLPLECDSFRCINRVRYMSQSRSRFLYTAQKELMKRLNVPFWDLYDMTYLSAFQTSEGDGRHYNAKFNELLSNYLFDTTCCDEHIKFRCTRCGRA